LLGDVLSAKRRRIGYVIGQLTQGGTERQLYELVRAVDRKSFETFVYCLSEKTAPFGDLISKTGAKLRVLRRRCHLDVARMRELASLLRRDRIDIVHSLLFEANAYAWPACFLAGVPHLVTSVRSCNSELDVLRRWVNRLAFRSSDAVICNGEVVRSFLARYFSVPRQKSIVIHNGIDLDQFQKSSAAPTTNGDPNCDHRVVITVARLVPEKDVNLFIEAAELLSDEYPNVRFVIVGDGPCRSELMRCVSESGLDEKISFFGERDDVPQLLANADVFWLTSKWEGLPNVVLEAMACGKPVVARDVGACRELIKHGETGFLVSARDARQFKEYTLNLFRDPCRRMDMGTAARKLVEDSFSVARMSEATEALYRSLF
jgi:glycosyltransferase involved in cell wall biosynthesis